MILTDDDGFVDDAAAAAMLLFCAVVGEMVGSVIEAGSLFVCGRLDMTVLGLAGVTSVAVVILGGCGGGGAGVVCVFI